MSCYTEGYITGITIKKGETPGKAEALSFEAVAPCRVRIDETDFGLFIDENGDKQLKDGKIAGALISPCWFSSKPIQKSDLCLTMS